MISGWKADVLALLAGALLPLSFAPFGWWPIALASLAVFQLIMRRDGIGRSLWRALLFGIGYFGVGVSWVYISISLFGNATLPLAAGITALFVLFLSGYIVLVVFLTRLLAQHRVPVGFMLPIVWVMIEWLRGWLFTGFGWLDIGYAFLDTPLAVYAPYVGVLGLSFLALSSVTLLLHSFDGSVLWISRLVGAALLLIIWVLPTLATFPVQTQADKQAISVALLQANIPQQIKWLKNQRQPTLKLYRDMTEAHWDKQLIVWPETAVPAYEDQVFEYLETLHTAAQLSDSHIVLGMPVRESHGDRYYNALGVLGNAQRGAESLYKKRHLVAFGEYLPLKSILDPLLDFLEIPMSNFSAGEVEQPLVRIGAHQVGAFICFEIAFANDVRQALPAAAYLVNISNDAWFGDSLALPSNTCKWRVCAHWKMAVMYYVQPIPGLPQLLMMLGDVLSSLTPFKQGVLTGKIQPMQGSTFYSRYGDYPLLIFLVLSLLLTRRIAPRFS